MQSSVTTENSLNNDRYSSLSSDCITWKRNTKTQERMMALNKRVVKIYRSNIIVGSFCNVHGDPDDKA